MKKLLSIFVLFSLMLCSCGKEIVVERKEFHPSDDEMTAVLNENNTEWTMYRSDLLSEEMKTYMVYTDDMTETNAESDGNEAVKTIGAFVTHKSDLGQRVAFQFVNRHINSDGIDNITEKAVNVCCDLFSVNAEDEILKEINKIKPEEDTPYTAWYKEYGGVYVWFTYGVENGEIIPLIFSINDEGIHNELLADIE
ncbi:MAG: hypothetical protein IJ410_08720 [Oscillospiraceae bacterium]|nr:hypothetical protein [Oscillospiraceae bacterium]